METTKRETPDGHAKNCPRANYTRRQSCTCGYDERRAREANEKRKDRARG